VALGPRHDRLKELRSKTRGGLLGVAVIQISHLMYHESSKALGWVNGWVVGWMGAPVLESNSDTAPSSSPCATPRTETLGASARVEL
jgi:hypothetical protein